jgi:hypothetical protein
MEIRPAKKPLQLWPIWAIWGVIFIWAEFLGGNPRAAVNWLWLALILSILVYSFNVKKFGKKYWKKTL